MNELVSIITPTYNSERFISETIESVFAQTYTNWELIIYDDASSDNTKQIIERYIEIDNRIKYFHNKENCGVAVTRNKALQQVKGRWIAFLDSDDVWLPNKLENQVRFMKENNYFFSYHRYVKIDEKSQLQGIMVSGIKRVSMNDIYRCCWLGCLTVMYDAKYIGLVQVEDTNCDDLAIWTKILSKSDCYLLKENLALYRERKNSLSSISIKKKLIRNYIFYREIEEKSILQSLWFVCMNIIVHSIKKIFYTHKYSIV